MPFFKPPELGSRQYLSRHDWAASLPAVPHALANHRCLTGQTDAGHRIRAGWVWRSGLLPNGAAPPPGTLARTVIDLRTVAEADEADSPGVGRVLLPLIPALPAPWASAVPPTDDEVADHYISLVESSRSALPAMFNLLADESRYPVHFHCRLGRDRTGVVVMLLLSHLCVRDDDVAADYALTADCGDGCLATPEVARRFLASVRERWGSTTELLRSRGCSDATLNDVKRLLLPTMCAAQ